MSKNKKLIKYSILILFIMAPIIDCLRRTPIKDIEVLGFSIIELFNIIIICYTTFLTLINIKNKKKEFLPLIVYSLILLGYIILHCINIMHFNSTIFPDSTPNIITETYYIIRVYYMPVLLLFTLIKNKDIFNLEFYSKLVKILICIISLSIVLLNIFKLSYATYAATNDSFVKYNIFDFYKSSDSPKLLSTRGWFDSGNEISAILLMLFPINIYLLYKENKKSNVFLYIIQFLSMIILGTRVSSIGAILITIATILINIFTKFISHDKLNIKIIICGLLCTTYFFFSPIGTYIMEYTPSDYNIEDEHSEHLKTITDEKELSDYIANSLYEFRINEEFIELYPIESDPIFWKSIALRNRNLNNDSRIMKTTIIKRIKERNNNKFDTLLGMGYTINFMDLERDYVYQYYLFGLLGIILIIPQLFIYLKETIKSLKNLRHISLLLTALIIMSPTLGFIVAYYSGHVFGWISPSYILVLTIAILCAQCGDNLQYKNIK